MLYDNYNGPEQQITGPDELDYIKLGQEIVARIKVAMQPAWDALVKGFGDFANTLVDVFNNIGLYTKPGRSRLRLRRHRTQRERRMLWKLWHYPRWPKKAWCCVTLPPMPSFYRPPLGLPLRWQDEQSQRRTIEPRQSLAPVLH